MFHLDCEPDTAEQRVAIYSEAVLWRGGGREGAEWPPVNFKFQFRLWCVRAAGAGTGAVLCVAGSCMEESRRVTTTTQILGDGWGIQ